MNDVRRNMFNHESNENLDLELQDKGPSHKDRCHKKREVILECGLRPSDAFLKLMMDKLRKDKYLSWIA